MIIHLPYALYFTSLVVSFFLFPVFIRILEKNKILDSPDDRKIHASHTPSMGGTPIFFSCVFSLLVWLPVDIADQFKYLFMSLSIMFLVGLRDDLIPLKPSTKILSQLIPILIFVYLSKERIHSFYEIYEIEIPVIITFIITSTFLLVFSNSLNLIDGIDGLAGSLCLLILFFFGFWFWIMGSSHYSLLAFCMAGGISSFLIFNWNPSKVFLGDTGALLLGLFIGYLGIVFLNTNEAASNFKELRFRSPVAAAIAILIIPILDTIRVVIVRLIKRQSPLQADKNHLHHLLLKGRLSHSQATLVLVLLNILFITMALVMREAHPLLNWSVLIILSLGSISLIVLFKELRLKPHTKKPCI